MPRLCAFVNTMTSFGAYELYYTGKIECAWLKEIDKNTPLWFKTAIESKYVKKTFKRQQWCCQQVNDPHLNYFLKDDIKNILSFILPTSTTSADLLINAELCPIMQLLQTIIPKRR